MLMVTQQVIKLLVAYKTINWERGLNQRAISITLINSAEIIGPSFVGMFFGSSPGRKGAVTENTRIR